MKTASLMTREIVVVSPTVSVGAAARIMETLRVRHLPVLDEQRLVGVLSDRDLLRCKPGLPCAEAMTTDPVTCAADATVGQIAELMIDHKIDALPIVAASGTLVGLITSTDLLWLLVELDHMQTLPVDFQALHWRTETEAG